jgi:hypothetical protein
LTSENIVVAVKNNNIESKRINLLIVAYEFSIVNMVTAACTAENHQRHEVSGLLGVIQGPCGIKHQWDAENAEYCIKDTHEDIIQFFRVFFPRFEFKGTIVASEISRKTDEHFPKRWMDLFKSVRDSITRRIHQSRILASSNANQIYRN